MATSTQNLFLWSVVGIAGVVVLDQFTGFFEKSGLSGLFDFSQSNKSLEDALVEQRRADDTRSETKRIIKESNAMGLEARIFDRWGFLIDRYAGNINVGRNFARWLIAAIIDRESGGDRYAVGASGEKGLMQMTPIATEDVNENFGTDFSVEDMFDPEVSIQAGSLFLELQRLRVGGDTVLWIASYNAGETGARAGRGRNYAFDVLDKMAVMREFNL